MTERHQKGTSGMLTDLEPHREALFRYALLQTRDASMAEDLVQATFLAALQSAGGFRGG